jgi:glycosyltransferase involved in cell wall biosynthesis
MRKNDVSFTKNRKSLLIITSDLGIGGVQKKIVDVCKEISRRQKLSINVVLKQKKTYEKQRDIFYERVSENVKKIYYKPKKGLLWYEAPYWLYSIWKVYKLKPNVILSFMEDNSLIASVSKAVFFWRKIKVVISYDNVPEIYLKHAHESKKKFVLWKILLKLCINIADVVVVPSETAKRNFLKEFGSKKKKIVVNKNWVLSKRKLFRRQKKYDVIYTGRVDVAKNLGLFVEVVTDLVNKHPDLLACIVGWGDEIDRITKKIFSLSVEKNIELAGTRENIFEYLSKSKIFLLTSEFEGLPISALEAMKCGLPVVTSDYPGAQELVIDGETGYICSEKKDFVNKINMLLDDKKLIRTMSKKAMDFVENNHGKRQLDEFVGLLLLD